MTIQEYNDYNSRLDWAEWLQKVVRKSLEGTGLRPDVEYRPAEYRKPSEKELEDNPEAQPEMTKPETYVLTITCPLEWRVINRLTGDDICVDKALEIAREVTEFASEAWPDHMISDVQYDRFRRLPGAFDWLTEQAPTIMHRLTMARMCETIGKRNVKYIDLYPDKLIIHTRRGNWRIDYDDFRERLEEVVVQMRPWMRKPIRGAYLKEIRNKKNTNKDDKDKTEG